MREMHKWKDKVSFSLDNRQIFFLFFGLSVIGCFVFALGVMVGKKVTWEPEGQVAALTGDSLALLEAEENPDAEQEFAFKEGLKQPATIAAAADDEVEAAGGEESAAAAPGKGPDMSHSVPATKPAKKASSVMAATQKPGKDAKGSRVFTLQMKAFSRAEEAEGFADRLRRNGHDVRVEQHEVRGRIWHRVRLGKFEQWDKALAAKAEFESAEHVIAYVVRD